MESTLQYLLETYIAMFAASSPFAAVAIYIPMTIDYSPKERLNTALKGCCFATVVILLFAILGNKFLDSVGIDMDAIRVAGGAILGMIGFEMLKAKDPGEIFSDGELNNQKADISITPLAVPIITGPGCISSFLIRQNDAKNLAEDIMAYAAIALIMGTFFFLFYLTCKGSNWIRPSLLKVTSRLSALIVLAIGVQFIVGGIKGFFFAS